MKIFLVLRLRREVRRPGAEGNIIWVRVLTELVTLMVSIKGALTLIQMPTGVVDAAGATTGFGFERWGVVLH